MLKKVLHINCTDSGSTGKIILEISKYITQKSWISILCTPKITDDTITQNTLTKYKTSGKYEQALFKRITMLTGLRYAASPLATHKIKRIIEKERPDIVHVHSANCYMVNLYSLFSYIRKNGIALVITNHAEFYYTGSCSHANDCDQWKTGCKKCADLRDAANSLLIDRTSETWNKMRKSLSAFKKIEVVSVSPWVRNRSNSSGIMQGISQSTILNGIDTSVFCKRTIRQEVYDLNKTTKKVILFVTASFTDDKTDPKGGYKVIELAEKIAAYAIIIVVGKSNVSRKLPQNMVLTGRIKEQVMLAELYCFADLTIVASRRETFSMPVAESMCCGTPVVGMQAGGPESVALKEYSEFVPYGDNEEFYKATIKWLSFDKKSYSNEISYVAKRVYSSQNMVEKYYQIYEKIYSNL